MNEAFSERNLATATWGAWAARVVSGLEGNEEFAN
jgi:hypothetical protein